MAAAEVSRNSGASAAGSGASTEFKAVAVVMCGGSGTRFWPMSRKALPKQYLALFGERY